MTTQGTINTLKECYSSDRFQFEFNCSMFLAGDSNKKLRQSIIQELTGEILPVSKCGLHKVSDILKASFEQLQLF